MKKAQTQRNKVVVQIRFAADSVEEAIQRVRQYMTSFPDFQILNVYLIEKKEAKST